VVRSALRRPKSPRPLLHADAKVAASADARQADTASPLKPPGWRMPPAQQQRLHCCGWPAPAPTPNKGDVAWMLTSLRWVLLMSIPALASFYGGLVRAKNILSDADAGIRRVLVDTRACGSYMATACVTENNATSVVSTGCSSNGMVRFGQGVNSAMRATFSKGVVLPEMRVCSIPGNLCRHHVLLILGAVAERMKSPPLLLFMVLLVYTFSYAPIAHMVWFWMGPMLYGG